MTLYLGWDVGGWHCDRGASRDALVLLTDGDDGPRLLGVPWRGNLRTLLSALRGRELVDAMVGLCAPNPPLGDVAVGIDTPLAWPSAFRNLVAGTDLPEMGGDGRDNPYTYRLCERWLAERGRTPLSPVKDMIGSQSTKGLHFLRRLPARETSTGVWRVSWDGLTLSAIEAYPSVARHSPSFLGRHAALVADLPRPLDDDSRDAVHCALIAHAFCRAPEELTAPSPDFPPDEGWVFVPRDGLADDANGDLDPA